MRHENTAVLRERILRLFAEQSKQRFSQIEQSLGARSNLVAYHLKALIAEGVLRKSGAGKQSMWSLTAKGESLLPQLDAQTSQSRKGGAGAQQLPLVVVLPAALRVDSKTKQRQVFLRRRSERPYQGYWSMPGGKVLFGESLEDAAVRKIRSVALDTGELRKGAVRVHAFMNETVLDSSDAGRAASANASILIKHHFLLVFVTVAVPAGTHTDPGAGRWFALRRLPRGIIPSDKWLLEELSHRDARRVRSGEIVMIDMRGALRETLIRSYNER